MSGAANSFPFLFQGLEHEVTDPGQLYFEPSGKVYNPQIQRELSQVGVQGISGAPNNGGGAGYGGFGNFGGHAGSPGGPSNLSTAFSDLATVGEAASLGSGFLSFGGTENPINIPISLVSDLSGLFDFGGDDDSAPPKPPKVHPIWPILGVRQGLTTDQTSAQRRTLHDFVTFTFNVGANFGLTVHITIDRYGHVYFGGGGQVGKSPGLFSGSFSGGDLNPSTPATSLQLKNYLTGWSVDCSYGRIGGGADVSYTFYTPLKGQYAWSYGAFSPQAGCAVTNSIQLKVKLW